MNTKQLKKISQDLKELSNDLKDNQLTKKVAIKCAPRIRQDLEDICELCVDLWYAAYTPIYYRRQYSLYSAYKVILHKYSVDLKTSAEYMSKGHRADNAERSDYLFNLTFVEGWHGGADYIESSKTDMWGVHPSPGTPWYRTKHPSRLKGKGIPWKHWSGYSAIQTVSPEQMIDEESDNYLLGGGSKLISKNAQEEINSAINETLMTYNVFKNY